MRRELPHQYTEGCVAYLNSLHMPVGIDCLDESSKSFVDTYFQSTFHRHFVFFLALNDTCEGSQVITACYGMIYKIKSCLISHYYR